MFDIPEIPALHYCATSSQQQTPAAMSNKRMKLRTKRKHVLFQEEEETFVHERLSQHEAAAALWYGHGELKQIHKEIVVGLMSTKPTGIANTKLPQDFEFSVRGLEEIRKRKPHKRQIRRQEYIRNVVALQQEQERVRLSGDSVDHSIHTEEIGAYAVQQSKSATLRALHYAALDADEARRVYQETFGMPRCSAAKTVSDCPDRDGGIIVASSRRLPCLPIAGGVPISQDSIARSA